MDEQNKPNIMADPNRPRMMMKKIKRPVNRMQPQMPNMPTSPSVNPANVSPFVQPEKAPVVERPADTFGTPRREGYRNSPTEDFVNKENSVAEDNSLPNEFKMDAFDLDAYLDDKAEDEAKAMQPTAKSPIEFDPRKPHFLGQEDIEIPELREDSHDDDYREELADSRLSSTLANNKILVALAVVVFFAGALVSRVIMGEQKVVRNGLQGVVINQEVPRGRARCGVAEKTQGCVLYIMNPQRQELNARDFYDLASQLTGRQRFVIETGNMRYANVKIRPGDIAQLNIPPL